MINIRKKMLHKNNIINAEYLFQNIGEKIVRNHWLITISFLVFGVFSIIGLKDLKTSVSMNNLFLENDPVIQDQQQFDSLFGNGEFIGILIETDDVFSSASVELIQDLSSRLISEIELIEATTSIATFINDSSSESLEERRFKLDQRKSVRGKLYSEDYKQAWILCNLKTYPDSEDTIDQHNDPSYLIGEEVLNLVDSYQILGYELIPTGIPVLLYQKSDDLLKDLTKVILLASIIALVLIILIMRSIQSIIGAILTIVISIGSVFGTMGWMKMTIDTTFMLISILLSIAVSIGYTIHIFIFFKRNTLITGNKKNSVVYAIKETGWPILFTAFTTIFALLSFMVVPIKAIKWVGLVSSISIFVVFITSMSLYVNIVEAST